jgi:hypothetical protein
MQPSQPVTMRRRRIARPPPHIRPRTGEGPRLVFHKPIAETDEV